MKFSTWNLGVVWVNGKADGQHRLNSEGRQVTLLPLLSCRVQTERVWPLSIAIQR